MTDYLKLMRDRGLYRGEWDDEKVSGLTPKYFWDRRTWLDFWGDLRIHRMVCLGPHVKLITASHDFSKGNVGPKVEKRVWLDASVFVGAFSVLYNCHLQHHAVVACGSVVRNMVVPPLTMIEGNPAVPIKQYVDGKWVPLSGKEDE